MEFLNTLKQSLMNNGYLEVDAEQVIKGLVDLSNIIQYEAEMREKQFMAEHEEHQRSCGMM